ncbi:chaplin [Actinospica sp. MGRD01-02]|uniref:Chaplin n=1 Tax=Actinospica acidithermotolerans TaxID=2828514 RepID=A0A941EKY4_9ACTN|nr:chaplin [Actinospica acidithermotolerans]
MHHSTKRRVVLGMTTGGLLIGGLGMGVAQADTVANGGAADSPGVLSGNLIQIPVSVPVNACGNQVSVLGVLDSASDNKCSNSGSAGSTAHGTATDSPGVGSGNVVQIPVSVPVNLCGNSVTGVGVGNTASGNDCSNGSGKDSDSTGGKAHGGSSDSPGVGSGNTVQMPVNVPVNACGNSVTVIGLLNSASDNNCSNGGTHTPGQQCSCQATTPPKTRPVHKPKHAAPKTKVWKSSGALAETGSGADKIVAPLGASALGGTSLLLRKRLSAAQQSNQSH